MSPVEQTPVDPAPVAADVTSTDAIRVVPEADWDALVERLGGLDTYTRVAYHRASVHLEPQGTRPVLLHCVGDSGELALPLLLRPLPGGDGWDATSAYGYGGPVSPGTPDPVAVSAALDGWARENHVAASFLRLHPLLDNARLVPAGAELVELGSTVAWDIAPGRDLLPAMHTHHRRAVRKADRAGLDVAVVSPPIDLAEFRALYDGTMRRQEAAAFYFFDDAYWQAMLTESADLGLVLVEGRLEGQLVAALLCFSDGARLHYHLGASADAARNIGASNRCFLAAAEWGQSRGMQHFHLGGGVGGGSESPLFVFKHRYDPTSEPRAFHIAKLVHDCDRYRALAGTDSTAGFFPPWRAPA